MRDALKEADDNLHGRGASRPRLAELSFSFDCRLGYRWSRLLRKHQLVMTFGRARFPWFDRRPLQQLHIVCMARHGWEPRISMNGKLVTLSSAAGSTP
jgi:hypothetical protein